MAGLGIRSHYLDELDAQYRPEGREPEAGAIVQAVLDAVDVDPSWTVWMPWAHYDSGRPTHPDHVLAREAAEQLARDTGASSRYFADLPYLHESAIADSTRVTVMSVRAERAKLHACRQYKTQWQHLGTKWRRLRTERYIRLEQERGPDRTSTS